MTEKGQWYHVSFLLSGSLHVGSGRWGFILPCRPYVPGWTLWGALVVLLKKTGRWPGQLGEIGCAVNQYCWLGHLFLEAGGAQTTYRYLPVMNQMQGGKNIFTWRDISGTSVDHLPPPTLFRHGVVRSHEQGQNSLGRLFLTESVQGRQGISYQLSGIFFYNGDKDKLPFQQEDRLLLGGNRQVNGAEIICSSVSPLGDNKALTLPKGYSKQHHLRPELSEGNLALTGELERIVMRRTRSACGKKSNGFGQHFLDWGIHLAPGWHSSNQQDHQPLFDKQDAFRHGTIQTIQNNST
ncbi:MAG: hypothetical protein Q3M24_13360 [Candidatus Electrothrix aestuarii]|uniref:Uncharacterized protein n=1 Tax=Candidatus Electrothrix aestuarii TaxID=3062594 RepID=A0AAU8LQY6_9BACT|nr:hypothetical protein [Candidatus Electrothrix aestuarii]WPD24668.1 MAG: hypothetical protein SD837_08915 [Candidatus Electrothrix sp. GW3-3]